MEPEELLEKFRKRSAIHYHHIERMLTILARYSVTDLKLMAQQRLPEHVAELVENLAACFEEPAAAPKSNLTLKLIQIVRVEPRVRSSKDQRVWVKRATGEYHGSDGGIYRKWFEAKQGQDPVVPTHGTHESLADVQYQWRIQ